LDRSSPSTGTKFSLLSRLALTLASVGAYAVIAWQDQMPEPFNMFRTLSDERYYVVGAIFGALVLGPYVALRGRALRILALAVASAVIYFFSVRFVILGPFGREATVSYVLAGAGAALLCGLAVLAIAPRTFVWQLIPIWLIAGAIGGAAFDFHSSYDRFFVIGHAAWQLLICVALHVGFRWLAPRSAAFSTRYE